MIKLNDLKNDFEFTDIELFRSLNLPTGASLMIERERRVIHSICRLHRPLRILEIGVAYGGGSAVILNAISDMPNSKLISIDVGDYEITGHIVNELMPGNKQWQLYKGKDPVEILDDINENYDLLIIDSMHLHPVETLNFLAAFPFLNRGAIVIIHDISMHAQSFANGNIAPQLLYSAIVADKLLIKRKSRNDFVNIGVLQINEDTPKYISNLFQVLNVNWYCPPHNYFKLKEFVLKHYDENCNILFDMAIDYAVRNELNPACLGLDIAEFYKKAFRDFSIKWQNTLFTDTVSSLSSYKRLVLYGGGQFCHHILMHLNLSTDKNVCMPDEIWDINATEIININGVPVITPKFDDLLIPNEYGVIITIGDYSVCEDIERKFLSIGFTNYVII